MQHCLGMLGSQERGPTGSGQLRLGDWLAGERVPSSAAFVTLEVVVPYLFLLNGPAESLQPYCGQIDCIHLLFVILIFVALT